MRSILRNCSRQCWPLALAGVFGLSLSVAWARADDGKERILIQKPEVAPSQVRGEAGEAAPKDIDRVDLMAGPAPQWIWGADADLAYVLRKEFPGDAQAARLIAAADNRMTLYLNGHRVVSSDNWTAPVVLDVQKYLKPGKNELLAEVANAGGPSGFALKLAITPEEGPTRYVVSDRSWQAAGSRKAKDWAAVRAVARMGKAPWGDVFAKAAEVPAGRVPREVFETLPGYQVERIFTIPRAQLGSWVSIAFDPKGRLIASDQGDKGLCRITLPPVGSDEPVKVEPLDVKISAAQGLLFAFDSLYVSVNGGAGSGLYRVRDTDGDDQFDQVEKLAELHGAGEHGPHSLRLSPDGKSILIVCGNHTDLPDTIDSSLVPRPWDEDLILPRQWDANGHARGRMAPGGWIAKTDPDGKTWEILSVGYRNSFDFAVDTEGELFAYDSDMEWDYGMPWYRPTRAVHAVSGSEFGWRSGTGKWPVYYPDSLPPMVNVGPGSPVGVAFGYGLKFPAKYQKALFACDWTFGTIYALHREPVGSTYKAVKEEFLSRTPLPLTDIAVGPDGALYFTIGGRGMQSELFRVTYIGDESTEPAELDEPRNLDLRELRRKIEKFHHRADDQAKAVATVWPYLGDTDRFLRYAARVALEHQEPKYWQDRVLAETNPERLITASVALARQGDKSLQGKLLAALDRLDLGSLDEAKQLELLRVYQLVFIRMGEPDAANASALVKKFDAYYPAESDFLNRELVNLLVYLESPTVAEKTIALMQQESHSESADLSELLTRNATYADPILKMLANRPEAQKIHYAFALRNLRDGWSLEDRKAYFQFLQKARGWSGGASYQGFINNIDKEAFENASEAERLAIEATGARAPFRAKELPKPEGPGHDWKLEELLALAPSKMKKGRNFKHGQRTFQAARCVVCHRFAGEGGATGPDLTQAAGRFGFKEMAEALIEPSQVVSDQYRASVVATDDGQVYTGRIISENDKSLTILVDPEDSTKVVEVPKDEVEAMKPSAESLMPKGLLSVLNEDEVLDMIAYLLSRGDPNDPMFKK